MISVVIPCYNAERFLSETVESALSQSYRDLEIILVDDGSTDATPGLIRSFGTRVRSEFLRHSGASAARNRGTELCRGEFIQYLDSDDLLTPDSLERKLAVLSTSGADIVYTAWQKLQETSGGFREGEVDSRAIEDVDPDPEIAVFTDFWAPPAAILYRRSIVDKIGGWSQTLPVIQDARFLLDAVMKGGRAVRVRGVGAYYRIALEASLSTRDLRAFTKDIFTNAAEVESLWRAGGKLQEGRKRALLKVYGYVARTSFENDPPLFKRASEKLFSIDPHYAPDSVCMRWATKIFGYPNAEAIASRWRKLRGLVAGKQAPHG